MSQANSAVSTILPAFATRSEAAEYRRLTYRLFRAEGLRYGRLYRLPALRAWHMARQYPLSLAERYAQALR
jgi:hypothetical protein